MEYEELDLAVMEMEGEGEKEKEKGPIMLMVSPGRTGVAVQFSRRWTVRHPEVKATFKEIVWRENVSGCCG